MAKLTGKAKQEFLARMNKGRIKAGLKRIGTKARSSLSKTKRSKGSKNMATQKTKSKTRAKFSFGNFKTGFKGFLGGTGAGELAEEGVLLVTDNPIATTVTKIGTSALAGWYVGDKKAAGLIGGLAGAGLDIALKLVTNRSQGQSRFSL